MSPSAASSGMRAWRRRVASRVSRTRLRTRVAGMMLVPLVPLALLSVSDLRRLDTESNAARGAADRIERSMPLHRLLSDLALEEMLSTARLKQSLSGVSEDAVRGQTGLDLNAIL